MWLSLHLGHHLPLSSSLLTQVALLICNAFALEFLLPGILFFYRPPWLAPSPPSNACSNVTSNIALTNLFIIAFSALFIIAYNLQIRGIIYLLILFFVCLPLWKWGWRFFFPVSLHLLLCPYRLEKCLKHYKGSECVNSSPLKILGWVFP